MNDQEQLIAAFEAQRPCIAIGTFEEAEARTVVHEAAIEAGLSLWEWSINGGVRDGLVEGSAAIADTEHPAAALYHMLQREGRFIAVMLDVAGHLKDERTMRMLREVIQKFNKSGSHLVLIDGQSELPGPIRAMSMRFELSLPDDAELESIARQTLRMRNQIKPVQIDISRKDFAAIVQNLRGLTARQARQVILEAVCRDHRFDGEDVHHVLAEKRRQLQTSGLLEYVESPVDLDQIGGLRQLKQWLGTRQDALSEEAAAFGIPSPRGILMLGVQGAGKSLAAKAVATAWHRPLLRMDVGALYDKFIGESERKLREALQQAETMAPIILWIDEIEKGFASAASQSSDGGLSKRMFGMLLTWMQERTEAVFLIATANDIEALPPELLRKGRFDEIFFVDLPTAEVRRDIFAIHLKKRRREAKLFDLAALAEAAAGFSGAEIEQAVIAGLHEAFAARAELKTEHVLRAIRTSPPLSVTAAEKLEALRRWAEGRCVKAD